MALSLLPTAALAKGEKVAKVGDTAEYTTLADAIEAAQGGETVTLLADITGQTVIPAGKNIVLDLNGKTMTHDGTTLYNRGTLTVRDSSADKSGKIVSTGNVGIGVDHNSTTTIEYAHIEAVEGAVITGYATGAEITIQDGIFAASDNAVIAGNGNSTDRNGKVRENANTITINGGKFTGNIKTDGYIACGIYAPWKDSVTVNGGEFTVNNGIGIVARAGQVKVNGGTFTCSGSAAGKVGDKNFNMTAAQCLYFDATDPAYPAYNSTTDYIKVTGGTFSSDVSAYVADGYTYNSETKTIEPLGETNAVVKVGDTYYKTLAAAIDAAQYGETIKLLKNVTENVTIPADKTITLDLNGMTLTNVDDHTILNNGNLTITGTGTVDNISHAKGALYNKGTAVINGGTFDRSHENGMNKGESGQNSWYTIKNVGTMTINDGATVQTAENNAARGKFSSLVSNGYFNANDYSTNKGLAQPILTIDGGTFCGGLNTIKNDDRAKLTINGGTFSNYYQAVVQNHNIAEITGGTFTAASDANAETYGIYNCGCGAEIDLGTLTVSGGTFTGATYAVAEVSSQGAIVNISGGQFAGTKAAIIKSSTSNATIAVSGGTFSSTVPVNCCAPGFEPKENEDGTYGVKITANLAAEVLDAQGKTVGAYDTLAAAITAAQNGDTVVLLKNVTEAVTIPADKTITLDLNGHTLVDSATAQDKNVAESSRKHTITNNGTLTILDSVGTGVVDNVSHGRAALYNAGTIVEIKGGKFTRSVDNSTDATSAKGNSWYVVYNAKNATINRISDGDFLAIGKFSSLFCNCGLIGEISGGTFTQDGFIAFKNEGCVNKISGGTFASKDESCIQNWGSIGEITGGTITAGSIGIWNFSSDKYSSVGKVGQISGGNISGSTAAIRLNDYDTTYLGKPSTTNKASVAVSGGNISGDLQINAHTELSVSGGSFSTDLKNTGYLADSVGAEVKSADGSTYGYYANVAAATAAAKPGDTVTDLKATTEQKVTLTLKYNDGATADTTYNVASGTSITLPTPAYRSGYTFNGWYDGSKFYAAGASYTVSATVTLNAFWSYISSGSGSYVPTYSVSTPSKTENGSVTVSPKNASKGDTVTVTVKPDSGYVLETLTVTDKNGNKLTLKYKGNGMYTFTMPAGKVEVKATFMEDNSMLNFFYDVPNGAYFYEAVKWAVKNGITTGVGNGLFAPEQPCTRAQIVTFLWRAAGSPEPKGTAAGMTDVVSGSYYEKAVAWAIENGITTGTTTSTFSPDATCTRAQAVTFLARALNAKATSVAEFSDVPTNSYFADAVAWAAANGVTEGIGGGLFGSDNDCTRGQIVTFLYRAYNK